MSRRYARYRDSGVEWLGDVPEHWEIGQLRRRFAVVNGGTPASANDAYWDGETVWLTPDDLGRNTRSWITEGRRRLTADGVRNSSARVCPKGSVVLSTRAPIGHLAILAASAATNQGCRTLVPDRRTDSCFAYYALMASRSVLQSLGKGSTFMELTPSDLGSLPVPFPPLVEQHAISRFLDRETERIDVLVEKKRLLIERLEEYRTALITRTVMRGLPPEAALAAGLDPSPRMKPSGVEWLGDVPVHWEVLLLRRIIQLSAGSGITSDEIEPEGEFRVFGGNGVRGFADSFTHDGEFVLIGRQGALCGNVHIARGRFWASEHAVVAKPLGHESAAWLGHVLDAMKLGQYSAAAAQPGLAVDRINALLMPVPHEAEQRAIADFLDQKVRKINALAIKVLRAIERLQEHRTALITAAVTGKIDVREAAQAPIAAMLA